MIRSCQSCYFYTEEWDGDYGGIYCGSWCELFENYPDQRFKPSFFPYMVAPGCYQPNFWGTKYADIIEDEMYSMGYDKAVQYAFDEYNEYLRTDGDYIKIVG